MLGQQPVDFTATALCAERLGGVIGEAPRGATAGHFGSTRMELGQAQGQGHAAYTPCGGFLGCCGGAGSGIG